ncbi:putative GTPase activating protein for Arf-domain-containing protein [Chaetomidium leptoderma]|uniref:GTPase activating protein for Arf-domain-containing protein n=1 Tax=Chaetomidium leptoderma TaxID=669021 RepID=A0AAN6ZZL8_9PEZI|nr:putative GTPase activating protein for Arf-domain-containing protein [Chaetomidium leptoderma]
MSRRPPNPAAERAAQNQQTIKNLLKLEPNKVCADCKRNKHPRWASWNLGVFVCIRCSGIHRGMGTHISRVKSVDLDSWTDEQLQSILSWGNARANKYWEAKLAVNHVPSEAKIENFIRTKYELKRWKMEGPVPDPATLDADGDDDVPLSVVKEKQNVERRESVRKASVGKSAAPQADLIGAEPIPAPLRASTTGPTAMQVPSKSGPAPPKATNTKDSLLGLDFLGTQATPPPRPASTTGTSSSGGQSRPDLKQSILSLYATAPRPQPQPVAQQASHAPSGSLGGMPSPTGMSQTQGCMGGGLNDAFSGLSFGNSPSPKPPQNDAFSSLGSFTSSRPTPQQSGSAFSALSGGSFFDSKPAASTHQPKQSIGSPSGWGSVASPAVASKPAAAPASSALGDLFDFSASSPPSATAPQQPALVPATATATSSVFNLSATQPKPSPPAAAPSMISNPLGSLSTNTWANSDVWGGNAWASAEAPKATPEPPKPTTTATTTASTDMGWASFASQPIVPGASGGFAPKVAADEEFGGWTSSTTTAQPSSTSKPAGSFGGGEDLFSNVWQ